MLESFLFLKHVLNIPLKSFKITSLRVIPTVTSYWNIFVTNPSASRFHQNYPLLLVPSPGSGSSSDHCDLSGQTDSNWLALCLIQNNFRRPGVSSRLGVSTRLGAWKLRFERYKTIWLSYYSGGYVSLRAPRRLKFNRDRSIETFFVTFLRTYLLTSFSDISSDISSDSLFWHSFWHFVWHILRHIFWHPFLP